MLNKEVADSLYNGLMVSAETKLWDTNAPEEIKAIYRWSRDNGMALHVADLVSSIADRDSREQAEEDRPEIIGSAVDLYTGELTSWLSAGDGENYRWCDTAIEQAGPYTATMDLLEGGQVAALEDVWPLLLEVLFDEEDEEEDEEEAGDWVRRSLPIWSAADGLMRPIGKHGRISLYAGRNADGQAIYNVQSTAGKPAGGYEDKTWIERIYGVNFDEFPHLRALYGAEAEQ